MIRLITCVCLFAGSLQWMLGAFDSDRQLSQFSTIHWDLEKGLPSNWVIDIEQIEGDPGLWIATPLGLVRFNGIEFELNNFRTFPSLAGGAWALEAGVENRLWVGSKKYGIFYLENRDFSVADDNLNLEVRKLLLDQQSRMWIGTPVGLFVQDEGGMQAFEPEVFSGVFVTDIFEDFRGNVWIGTQDKGLYRIEVDRDDSVIHMGEDTTVYCIHSDLEHHLWVGGKNGLLIYEHDQLEETITIEDGLPTNSVRALFCDSSGCMWVGTENGIVRIVDGKVFENPPGAPFEGDFITCFFEDREGSLWVGSKYHGFAQVWTGRFTVFSSDEGLENDVINVVYDDGVQLLLGTNRGLYAFDGLKPHPIEPEMLGSARIRDVFRDFDGRLWVCTYSGLYCFQKEGGMRHWGVEEGLSSNLVRQVMEDRKGNIWVGTRSGLNRFDGESITCWTSPELRNDLILHVFEDHSGQLWIATDGGGVAKLQEGQFVWYTSVDGLSNDVVFKIYEDNDGLLWFATASGISMYDGKEFHTIRAEDGLPGETIFQVIEDHEGNLWLTAHEGIYRIRKAELLAYLHDPELKDFEVFRYGTNDGLKTYQMTGVGESCLRADGTLCFATAKGLAIHKSNGDDVGSVHPGVYFESVLVDGKPLKLPLSRHHMRFTLAPGEQRLEIRYASTTLIGSESILFSTRLEGFEHRNSETLERRAVYTNLKPGSYRFDVKARNSDGVWGGEFESIVFEVKPYFHQTQWFYAVIILMSVLLGYALYSARIFQLRRQRAILEEKVKERTLEISRQKEVIEGKNLEIEHNYTKLQESNVELKKLSEERTYILGIAAHDIRNPLGNMVVLSEAILESPSASQNDVRESLKMIHQSGKDLLDLVGSLVQSISLESGVEPLKKEYVDLVQIVKSVVNINHGYAQAKAQQLVVDVPDHVMMANVDSQRLRASMDNYVSNAIKYSPLSSTIQVTILEEREAGARWAKFVVSDEGPGLAAGDFERVFGRFSKLSAKPTGQESSSGMGLSIVKQTVELHGGFVKVENNAGKGATFSFRIPL